MPGIFIFILGISLFLKKNRQLGFFIISTIINFILFASYNYILNYFDFSNFFGPDYFMVVSKNYYGIKGLFANLIK